jgi:orotate phosphoribosyltransferase-like protein
MDDESFPYRSLSSIGRRLLPRAKRMHRNGLSWSEVAEHLDVSRRSLFIWRRVEERSGRGGSDVLEGG